MNLMHGKDSLRRGLVRALGLREEFFCHFTILECFGRLLDGAVQIRQIQRCEPWRSYQDENGGEKKKKASSLSQTLGVQIVEALPLLKRFHKRDDGFVDACERKLRQRK